MLFLWSRYIGCSICQYYFYQYNKNRKIVHILVAHYRIYLLCLYPFSWFMAILIFIPHAIFLCNIFLDLHFSVIHSLVLFYQIMALNATINSNSYALLTLLISNNFIELKTSVFKRFNPDNIFQITCAGKASFLRNCLSLIFFSVFVIKISWKDFNCLCF